MNLNSEIVENNKQIHHKNNHNTTSDEGVHRSWATSPGPASNGLTLYHYVKKWWLHLFTMLQWLQNLFH